MAIARNYLFVLAAGLFAFGPYIFFFPQQFYDLIPGLAAMGPFSIHFIRDVGLAFLACGILTFWGAARGDWRLVLAGLLWPNLHGLFHLQIWGMRGFPLDHIFFFDLFVAIIPPALGLLACRALARSGPPAT